MLVGARRRFRSDARNWRVSGNANHLWFENTATLQALRNEGSIPKDDRLGPVDRHGDLAAQGDQNLVFRTFRRRALLPGAAFAISSTTERPPDKVYYSVLFNAILTY